MPTESWFEPKQYYLSEILTAIHEGRTQLPDFQRDWVWDLERIRDLLASVSQGWPIGAILLLATGGEVRFRPRRFKGVDVENPSPEHLVLDGQQRLTSLFLALKRDLPVLTRDHRDNEVSCWFYFDMVRCLDGTDRTDAILDVPADRVRRKNFDRTVDLDLSTPAREYEHGLVPAAVAADADRFREWHYQYSVYHHHDRERNQLCNRFASAVLDRLQQYSVPAILMSRNVKRRAICMVFEKVNTGGKRLDVFELVTASWAGEEESFVLQDRWKEVEARLHRHPVLADVRGPDFLQAITLLHTLEGGQPKGKREDILDLPVVAWHLQAARVEQGFVAAGDLLETIHVTPDLLPYGAQLIPLAVILARLGPRAQEPDVRSKVLRWFWSGVFGELYGSATETRFVADVQQVPAWVEGGAEPDTVRDCSFSPLRLLTLKSRNSAAYKGLIALGTAQGARDWKTGRPVTKDPYDIHHIFPRLWCQAQHPEPMGWDSILNKTQLTDRTNKLLRGDAPSAYLERLERIHGVTSADLDAHVGSHLVHPQLLRIDDYAAFLRDRGRRLLDLVESATGKAILGRDSEQVRQKFGGALPPRPPESVHPPLFGQYKVIERLGQFGFSECFKVRAPDGAICFLKRVPLDSYDDAVLARERSIYDRLDREGCDSVLRVMDFQRDTSHAALLLEWADGGSLEDFVRKQHGGHLDGATAKKLASEILFNLFELHELGLVHRDLKPSNILQVRGAWKLADFGIARDTHRILTRRTFQGAGTVCWAPAEQFEGVDAHTSQDVYAFGKILAWMLTGQTDPDAIQGPLWRQLVRDCTAQDPRERPDLEDIEQRMTRIHSAPG